MREEAQKELEDKRNSAAGRENVSRKGAKEKLPKTIQRRRTSAMVLLRVLCASARTFFSPPPASTIGGGEERIPYLFLCVLGAFARNILAQKNPSYCSSAFSVIVRIWSARTLRRVW